jgi:hypothetical protein
LGDSSTFEKKSIMVLTATLIDASWYVFMSFIFAMPILMKKLAPNLQTLEFIIGCIFAVVCILLGYKIVIGLLG